MDDILALSEGLPERVFAAGEALVTEGSQSGQIFVLVSGVVGVEIGEVLVLRVSEPGAFLGEISALLGIPHSARVVALEETRTRELPSGDVTASPEMLLGMARLLAARLHAMTGYVVDLRRQYGDDATQLGLMAEVLSELTAVRPVAIAPGSARDDVPDY